MKYEMIFGDKGLFDSLIVPNHAEVLRYNDYSKEYLWGDLNTVKLLTSKELEDIPIVAMRRIIIKEHKRWTWEDKKAGRLPEVGCDIQYIDSQKRVSVIAINSNEIVLLAKSNGSKFFVLDPYSLLQYYNPIETPDEKAQREEDEFVTSLCKELDGTSLQHDSIYERGVRAAYRKLKGGE